MSNMGVITLSSLLSLLKETRAGRMASLRSKLAHYQCQRRSTISLRARLSLFWDTAAPVWQQHRHRERRKDYASQNWRLLFTFATREWRTGSAQSRTSRGGQYTEIAGAASCPVPTWSREPPARLPQYISVSLGEPVSPLSSWRRTHYCSFGGTWVARACLVVQ